MNSQTMNQQARHAITAIWQDCWRRDQPVEMQYRRFAERMKSLVEDATGQTINIYRYERGDNAV